MFESKLANQNVPKHRVRKRPSDSAKAVFCMADQPNTTRPG
jgi:hypothetical protein